MSMESGPFRGESTSGRVIAGAMNAPVNIVRTTLSPATLKSSYQREGFMGATIDTGLRGAGAVTREVLGAATGVVGYGIGKTRDAVLGTLGFGARVGWAAARNAEIIPFVQSPQQMVELQRRRPSASSDELNLLAFGEALGRIANIGQRPGTPPAGPDTQSPA
ncbi:hypothetical protein HZA87_05980 [Candidatus Uhrbacteria bacterium]|nr:hypothetical protein [Candidatus Uhrbacteria bacterium]